MKLAIFKYQEGSKTTNLTAIEIDGEPWFVASEACVMLEIKNSRDAVSTLDDDEKGMSVLPTSSGNQNVNIINESGLYNLVFRSRKESAKKFRKWVTQVVIPAIRKTGSYSANRIETPNFVTRYNENWHKVAAGHFSVISELFIRLYGRFEHVGYQIPNKAFDGKEIRPDASVGKLFSTFLKAYHPHIADKYTYYKHSFPNGFECEARQYPNDLLPLFINYIDEHWMPKCAAKYFGERDKLALTYLPKLLGRGR